MNEHTDTWYEDSKELEAIRVVFDYGADDELRFPGATLSDSVKILIEKYLKYKEMFDMQTRIVLDLEMRLLEMEEQIKTMTWNRL
jgi:hypothetical protein